IHFKLDPPLLRWEFLVLLCDSDSLVERIFSNERPQGLGDVFRADCTKLDNAGESSLINKIRVDDSEQKPHYHGRDGIVYVNQDRGALSDPAFEHGIEVATPS